MKWKRQKGASVVEFAIALPLLLLLLFGFIEFGAILYNQQVLTNASREGARAAVTPFAVAPDGDLRQLTYEEVEAIVVQYCQDNLHAFRPPNPSCTLDPIDNGRAFGDLVQVTVTSNYSFLLPAIIGVGNSLTLRSRTEMRMM